VYLFIFIYFERSSKVFSGTGSHIQCAVQIHMVIYFTDAYIFQKNLGANLQILGTGKGVTRCKFHAEESQISGAAVQDLVARATW